MNMKKESKDQEKTARLRLVKPHQNKIHIQRDSTPMFQGISLRKKEKNKFKEVAMIKNWSFLQIKFKE